MQLIQSINFHHDAVTGTHFDDVGYWYDRFMVIALNENKKLLESITEAEAKRQGLLV
jgi:hypothetical protein